MSPRIYEEFKMTRTRKYRDKSKKDETGGEIIPH